MRAVASSLAWDLDELDLAPGRARGPLVAASQLDRHGFVERPVHEQRGHAERQQAHRVADGVTLGELLGRAAHQRARSAAAPRTPVGAGEVAHAGLRDDARDCHGRGAGDVSGGALGEFVAAGGPQREVAAGGVPDDRDRVEQEWRVELGEVVNRGGDVRERRGPAAAAAHAPVLDVPHGPAARDEVAGEAAHHGPSVASPPRAAVDQDDHRVRLRAGRQVQLGALGAMGAVAEGASALEQVEDLTGVSHCGRILTDRTGGAAGRAEVLAATYDHAVSTEQDDLPHVTRAPAAPSDVVDFLCAHPPFDALERVEVERAAACAEVEFFLAGVTIFAQDARPIEHLRVVRTGAVEIVLGDRVLDLLAPGELLGHASMLSGLPPGFSARAQEDTLCYRIPEEIARSVLARPESVGFVARSLLEMHARWPRPSAPGKPAPDPANQPVAALIRDPPLLCAPSTTIREAAARMAAASASAIVIELGDSLGILTDRDLRTRVVAAGVSYEGRVSSVMSAPAYTVEADMLGGDVLLEMLDRGVRHFPVLAPAGQVIGVVEAVDLQAVETLSSFYLRRAIARAGDVMELARVSQGVRPSVIALHEARVAASSVAAIYSVVLDALTRRLIELALACAGEPPAEFSWLALGSQARREAVPSSDADSAIVWYGDAEEELVRPYLHGLASTVADGLEACGIRTDRHGASASELLFVRSLESWRRVSLDWIEHPTREQALVLVSVLVDSRPLWGVHTGRPVSDTFRAAASRPELLHLLARFALSHRPPTGFLRGLVVEHDGEHRGRLDLKRGGLLPVVDLARWAGMAAGVTSASTLARLRAAADAGTLPASDARTLEDAFELFTELRVEHQVDQLRDGLEPDDHVDPEELSALTRSYLREAFRAVASVQRRIAAELSLGVR